MASGHFYLGHPVPSITSFATFQREGHETIYLPTTTVRFPLNQVVERVFRGKGARIMSKKVSASTVGA